MSNIELSILVANLEQLKTAINSGADSVYIGGEFFGTESSIRNFTNEELEDGVEFVHEKGKKIYVTINVMPHNDDFNNLEEYLLYLEKIRIDAIILSDPGVLTVAKKVTPNIEIHLNTQSNTTNYVSANFWHKQGVKRVVISTELSMDEIAQTRAKTDSELEIETLVHGAMCISYSGRRLISNYMSGKNASKELCQNSNEWKYYLEEEKRPGEYFPIYEDEKGTFFFYPKDLCLIENIPELVKSGATCFKIETRKQTTEYIKTIVEVYKMAIEEFEKNHDEWKCNPIWLDKIQNVSDRELTTGFYLDKVNTEN